MEREDKRLIGYFSLANVLDVGLTSVQFRVVNHGSEYGIGANLLFTNPEADLEKAIFAKAILIIGFIGVTTAMAHLKEINVLNRQIDVQYVARKSLKWATACYVIFVLWNEFNIIFDKYNGLW